MKHSLYVYICTLYIHINICVVVCIQYVYVCVFVKGTNVCEAALCELYLISFICSSDKHWLLSPYYAAAASKHSPLALCSWCSRVNFINSHIFLYSLYIAVYMYVYKRVYKLAFAFYIKCTCTRIVQFILITYKVYSTFIYWRKCLFIHRPYTMHTYVCIHKIYVYICVFLFGYLRLVVSQLMRTTIFWILYVGILYIYDAVLKFMARKFEYEI